MGNKTTTDRDFPRFGSNAEAALFWADYGLQVVPIIDEPHSALRWARSLAGLPREEMEDHWTNHPDHGVGCVVGPEMLVLSSRTANLAILRELGAPPLLAVETTRGVSYFFRLASDVDAKAASSIEHGIKVRLSGSVVALPSAAGGRFHNYSAKRVSMLGELSQEDMGKLVEYNDTVEETPAPEPTAEPVSNIDPSNPLLGFSLLGSADEVERRAMEQKPLLGDVCLTGEATVWYAKPSTGKTLILINLLTSAIQQGRIDPSKVFYVDVDDSSSGLALKLRILEEFGVHVLAQGYKGFKASELMPILEGMIERDEVHGLFLILDTLKKFTKLMDKQKSSEFAEIARQFVLKGGTLLCLSHTNKNFGSDGKPVYGGTSDIVDDFDCSYLIATVSEQADERIVEFTCIKSRGDTAQSAAYSFTLERGISYLERVTSVQLVDNDRFGFAKAAAEQQSDAVVVAAVEACLREGINTKMQLASQVATRTRLSQRAALNLIEKYTGEDPTCHRWTYSVQAHGAKVYRLLDPGREP